MRRYILMVLVCLGMLCGANAQEKGTLEEQTAIAKLNIVNKVRRFINLPPNTDPRAQVTVDLVLLPNGEILAANVVNASGNPAFDDAVLRAVNRAKPLPVPSDPALFSSFRHMQITFRPRE